MSRYVKGAALGFAVLLMCAPLGCLCPGLCKKRTPPVCAEVPPTPPPAPPYVAPAPEPAPEPTPPPAPLPPAVTKQIEDLSEKYPGMFQFDKDKGLLYFNTDALFDSGSAVVKPGARTALVKLADILREDEVKDRRLTIIGHTDSDRVVKPATIRTLRSLGKPANNMGLSEARAEAVAAVMEAEGIAPSRMTTAGRGDTQPVADNHTPTGKARNRRVEVYVTPMKSGT